MAKRPVKYSVVDAFAESAFKGNPAAVCLLEEDRDNQWFRLRWFSPVNEVKLCGHATLAAAHTLFKSGSISSDVIEFLTLSGILTAKKVQLDHVKAANGSASPNGAQAQDSYFIELNFPADPSSELNSADASLISKALGGASAIHTRRTTIMDNYLLCFHQETLRFFCPKFGVNEDHVCGIAHCALAPYWCKKLGKCDIVAYQASPRGGILYIHLDEQNQRVLLRGKAVTVMEGTVLV
ncbi:hypothetical protein M0R45_010878 [Rubus argutus]|uniref:Phenazine biosynthesis PhzC/PhzF protein n=1 Tax=Rubus argutus TaxID=59490 RepID=A0AAW1YC31_RUBAR